MTYPSLPTKARLQILDAVGCHTILYAATAEATLQCEELKAQRPSIRSFVVPEQSDWLGGSDVATYVYDKMWEAAIDDPVVDFHTSGATGMYQIATVDPECVRIEPFPGSPKPVVYRNSTLVSLDAQYKLGQVGPPLLVNSWAGRRILNNFLIYHMGFRCFTFESFLTKLGRIHEVPANLHNFPSTFPVQFKGLMESSSDSSRLLEI